MNMIHIVSLLKYLTLIIMLITLLLSVKSIILKKSKISIFYIPLFILMTFSLILNIQTEKSYIYQYNNLKSNSSFIVTTFDGDEQYAIDCVSEENDKVCNVIYLNNHIVEMKVKSYKINKNNQ